MSSASFANYSQAADLWWRQIPFLAHLLTPTHPVQPSALRTVIAAKLATELEFLTNATVGFRFLTAP